MPRIVAVETHFDAIARHDVGDVHLEDVGPLSFQQGGRSALFLRVLVLVRASDRFSISATSVRSPIFISIAKTTGRVDPGKT